ncbi:UNVERIFIED_CONTAM: hypothetical protein Scaly_2706200 [Sesamum calycinum]|uniref:Integrase catalytic domain-containing protein n=1 Tax=Sesamum calycinum TaxID=2727403 RepID=A0AAW2J4L7_9LAMI
MQVSVANGTRIVSDMYCPKFTWRMQDQKFNYPLRVIKLGGCNVVLGGDWLRKHKPVEYNYEDMKVTVARDGKRLILKALTKVNAHHAEFQMISVKSMKRLILRGNYNLMGQLSVVNSEGGNSIRTDTVLEAMLEEFSDDFQELNELLDELHGSCYFSKIDLRSVEYLGHVTSAEGVAIDPSKIEGMLTWPTPKDVKMDRTDTKSYTNDVEFQNILQAKVIDKDTYHEYSILNDFIEGYLVLKEKITLVVVDRLTKLHGLPLNIVSDRDKIFTSDFLWKELFKPLGTELSDSTAYHLQTDGQTERVNQCLEAYLKCMTQQGPRQWTKWISLAKYWTHLIKILARKMILRNNALVTQITIQSKGFEEDQATWEEYYQIQKQYPDFDLSPRGQGSQEQGRNVTARDAIGPRKPGAD